MKKRKNKKPKIRFRYLIILFISIYLLSIALNQNKLKRELAIKEKEVQNEIDILQEEIGELNQELEKKDTLEFLEKTAREELGMVKPNEIIYIDKNKFKNSIYNFFEADK